MRRFGIGFLAYILGVAALFAVQIGVTRLWGSFGVFWSPENLPNLPIQQTAALSTVFTAVLLGSFVAALVAKRDAWRVLLAMCLVGVSVDGYFMLIKLKDDLPLWFRLSFVTLIPVATVLAGYLHYRLWPSPTTEERHLHRTM